MTVKELREKLSEFSDECLVYVPSDDGRCDTVVTVSPIRHLEVPDGIAIPDDVGLLPWTDEEYEQKFG